MKKKRTIYRAVITHSGTPGQREPSARVFAGRELHGEFPMGWNMGESLPVGTEGWAQYISTTSMGLWKFYLTHPQNGPAKG